jgi:hypothetical protein
MNRNTAVLLWLLATLESTFVVALSVYLAVNYSPNWLWLMLLLIGVGIQTPSGELK